MEFFVVVVGKIFCILNVITTVFVKEKKGVRSHTKKKSIKVSLFEQAFSEGDFSCQVRKL